MSARKLDDAFVHSTAAQFPNVDVFALAAGVREYCEKVDVENPNGLLVVWVRRADKSRRDGGIARAQVDRERYAELWVQLLEIAVVERTSPVELAELLRAAARNGFEAINPVLIERLEGIGNFWPAGMKAQAKTR